MGITVKFLAMITAIGAIHSAVHWYTDTNYMSDTLGAQPTMAIQTVVALAAGGLMVAVFRTPKSKKG